MKLHQSIAIWVFFLAGISAANAQDYLARVKHYSELDGLLHREVNCILQDQRGFIWMATKEGLCRFDGHSFVPYTEEQTGTPFKSIWNMCEDSDGFFWMSDWRLNFKGDFYIWHPERNERTTARALMNRAGLSEDIELFPSVFSGEDEAIYLSTSKPVGYLRYTPKEGFQQVKLEQYKQVEVFSASRNKIWAMAERKYLVSFDHNGEAIEEVEVSGFLAHEQLRSKRHPPFSYLTTTQHSQGDWQAFICWDDTTVDHQRASPFAIPFEMPLANGNIQRLKFGNGTLFDDQGQELLNIRDQIPKISFPNRCYLIDTKGRLWLGGNFGVHVIEFQQNKFNIYFKGNVDIPTEYQACRGIARAGNNIFFCFENKDFWYLNLTEADQPKKWILPDLNYFLSIEPLSPNALAVGSINGLYHFNLENDRYTKYPSKGKSVWAIGKISESSLWFGIENSGLSTINLQTSTQTPFDQYNEFTALAEATVYQIESKPNGTIWICSDNGFYIGSQEKGITARYSTEGDGRFYIPHNTIYHIHEDAEGIAWLATGGGGLIRLDINARQAKSKSHYNQYTRAEGLSNNVIYASYSDDNNALWLSSNNGIMRIDKETGLVTTFLEADGISHREFNRISHYQDQNGQIYFGGINGVTTFNPNDIFPINRPSNFPLVITDFKQFDGAQNKMVSKTNLLVETNEITLQPSDRFFRLEFALLSFFDPDRNLYAYQFEGIDEDWTYQNEHTLQFGKLPYGTHTLRIKAQDAYGNWSENELSIQVCVLRPFYLKAWFIIGIAMLILALGITTIRWRIASLKKTQSKLENEVKRQTATIRKQTEELRHLDQVKSRFFANVSHELRTPLTLMLGPIHSLLDKAPVKDKERKWLETAQRNGLLLQQLINEILDLSKLDAGKMEIRENPIILHDFLKRIVAQFEWHAERQNIQFVFQNKVDSDLQILIDDSKLEKILYNYLSNAFKFTPEGGRVVLVVQELDTTIRVEVVDSGRGITAEDIPFIFDRYFQSKRPDSPIEGGTGIGLALCKELAAVMEGKVWVESQYGAGSRFGLEFPKNVIAIVSGAKALPDSTHFRKTALPISDQTNTSTSSSQISLLIVEDNDDLRDYVSTLLAEQYNVTAVENGQIALEYLNKNTPPELIISDIMMPVLDGFQLLEQLKGQGKWRHIPLIMLTARADIQDKLRALRIGVDDYLLKPFNEEELKARIENLLQFVHQRKSAKGTNGSSQALLSDPHVEWLEELEQQTEQLLGDPRFSVSFLANAMNVTSRQLQRRLKSATGLTVNRYIQEARLQRGRRLLEGGNYLVKEVAAEVGFKDPHYFSSLFRERFGKTPSELER